MHFIKGLDLPIVWQDEEDCILENLGLAVATDYEKIKIVRFYSINLVSDYVEKGKELTEIYSNGMSFICPLSMKEVFKMIENQIDAI